MAMDDSRPRTLFERIADSAVGLSRDATLPKVSRQDLNHLRHTQKAVVNDAISRTAIDLDSESGPSIKNGARYSSRQLDHETFRSPRQNLHLDIDEFTNHHADVDMNYDGLENIRTKNPQLELDPLWGHEQMHAPGTPISPESQAGPIRTRSQTTSRTQAQAVDRAALVTGHFRAQESIDLQPRKQDSTHSTRFRNTTNLHQLSYTEQQQRLREQRRLISQHTPSLQNLAQIPSQSMDAHHQEILDENQRCVEQMQQELHSMESRTHDQHHIQNPSHIQHPVQQSKPNEASNNAEEEEEDDEETDPFHCPYPACHDALQRGAQHGRTEDGKAECLVCVHDGCGMAFIERGEWRAHVWAPHHDLIGFVADGPGVVDEGAAELGTAKIAGAERQRQSDGEGWDEMWDDARN